MRTLLSSILTTEATQDKVIEMTRYIWVTIKVLWWVESKLYTEE